MQSKDSFESVGSAGTPDADMMHHSDLTNIKLKTDAESAKRMHKKNSSASSPQQHHYQNASDKQKHQSAPKGSPVTTRTAQPTHKRKGAPHALPTPQDEDIMGPEHEYEDIPGQSDDEEGTKEDRWNDTGDAEDKDELDVDMDQRREGELEDEESSRGATNNSNDTRTLTQQCSLVAPNEVQITESPALIAEPVLSESGKEGSDECFLSLWPTVINPEVELWRVLY